ncbi:MAG: hypothetical protein VW455_14355 [Nitrospinota bacterium]
MIKDLEDVFFKKVFSKPKDQPDYPSKNEMKELMEDLIKKKEAGVDELKEFKSLDLKIGKEFFEHEDEQELEETVRPASIPEIQQQEESRGMEGFLIPYSDLMSILFAFLFWYMRYQI